MQIRWSGRTILILTKMKRLKDLMMFRKADNREKFFIERYLNFTANQAKKWRNS